MHLGSRPSVRGACCLEIGFRHMREFTQLLGARLLVLVLQAMGAIFNLFYICFTLDNQIMV